MTRTRSCPGTPTGLDLFRGSISRIQFDPNDPSTFYFTMFNYGAFRAKITPAGTTVTQIFTEPNPNPPGPSGLAGIRFELAVAGLPNGKTRIYLGEGSDEVGGTPPTVDGSKLWRTDDAAAVDGQRELDAAVQQDGRHARLQLVRLLPEPVLVRHAGRVAARAAGRGLARRRHAVPGAAVAHGALPLERPRGHALGRRRRAVHGLDRRRDGTSSSTSIRTSTRSRSRRAGSRSSPPTAASRARAVNYVDFSSDCDTRSLTGVSLQDCRDLAVGDPGSDHRDELGAERARVPGAGGRSERPERHHRRHAGQRLADVRREPVADGRPRRRRPDGHRHRREGALPPVLRRLAAGELGRHRPDAGSLDVDLGLDARLG